MITSQQIQGFTPLPPHMVNIQTGIAGWSKLTHVLLLKSSLFPQRKSPRTVTNNSSHMLRCSRRGKSGEKSCVFLPLPADLLFPFMWQRMSHG